LDAQREVRGKTIKQIRRCWEGATTGEDNDEGATGKDEDEGATGEDGDEGATGGDDDGDEGPSVKVLELKMKMKIKRLAILSHL
jgi:hypothetical protein